MNTYGERLKHYRLAKELTQKQLASLAGTTQQTVQKAEKAVRPSRLNYKFAQILEINESDLSEGPEKKHKQQKTSSKKQKLMAVLLDCPDETIDEFIDIAEVLLKRKRGNS